MKLDLERLPGVVDVAAISADTTSSDIDFAVDLAKAYNCASTCVNPSYLAQSIKRKEGRTDVLSGSTAAFPFGGEITAAKLYACQQSVLLGAEEIDMVMNVGLFLSGQLEAVKKELELICETVAVPVKIIIETALLEDEQIVAASRLAADCGARYVKSSTGIYGKKVTPEIVRLMKEGAEGRAQIKASGGIRTLEEAEALLEAGADRLGMSPKPAFEVFRQLDKKLGRSTPDLRC